MEFISEELAEYIGDHTSTQSEHLAALEKETWQKILIPRMLSGHVQGKFLSFISAMIRPKRILEIGTYTGYSAICLADGLSEGGVIDTLEINDELSWIQDKYWELTGVKEKINRHIGPALQTLKQLDHTYDLIFIDADKENLSNYYDICKPMLSKSGAILVDNVLWSGKVVEEVQDKDKDTKAILALNQKIHNDPEMENLLLGIRDGIMMARWK